MPPRSGGRGYASGAAVRRRLHAINAAMAEATPEVNNKTRNRAVKKRVQATVLPVVDLSSADAALQLADACTRVGFQCVVNHGVTREALAAAHACEQFIGHASASDLDLLRKPTLGYGPGFQASGHMQSEKYQTHHGEYKGAKREDFVVVHPETAARKASGDPYYNTEPAQLWYADCANRFPADDGCRMQSALEGYYMAMEALSQRVMGMCGEILAGDRRKFEHVASRSLTNLVIGFHEARESGSAGVDETSVSAHSDSALFTLINYGSAGPEGLEVQDQTTGDWHHVSAEDVPPGALILNIGDAMRHLSNGRFLSTPHRVVAPARSATQQASDRRRLALVFFFAPDYDVPLVPVGAGGYGSVVFGGMTTHGYNVAPEKDKEAFDRWCLTRSINARTPYDIS